MKLDLWFSADSCDCRFICVRIVINRHTEFSLHQMQIKRSKSRFFFGQSSDPDPDGSSRRSARPPPPSRMGKPLLFAAYGVSI